MSELATIEDGTPEAVVVMTIGLNYLRFAIALLEEDDDDKLDEVAGLFRVLGKTMERLGQIANDPAAAGGEEAMASLATLLETRNIDAARTVLARGQAIRDRVERETLG